VRRRGVLPALLITLAISAAMAFQRIPPRFLVEREIVMPPDANEKTEFAFARLRYQNVRASGIWAMRGGWTVDSPKADRQLLQGVRRLTRIHARSVEQVVDLVSDDIFNYPFVYAVEAGHWDLPDAQAKKLREFIDRGGFLMTDDFHGTFEWSVFMAGLSKAFPESAVVDIDSADPIFHVIYDLDERFQVPGIIHFQTGVTYEYDGYEPKWRALRDRKGRIVVAICHNMDLGDAWEWADAPEYPERYTSLAYRIAMNYIVYSMSH
jgi:hypothetical protein